MRFRDRRDAGRELARTLDRYREQDPVIVGLPRGGVPVAFEVARALGAPLDVILVRKLGVPHQPELGFGAIGEDGVRVIRDEIVRAAGVTSEDIATVEARERDEITRRADMLRRGQPPVPLDGRTVIVVDDGLATGSTARAALQVAKAHGAARVVLAVPVAPPETLARMRGAADEIVCLAAPSGFQAVGQYYRDFTQVTDETVVELLSSARPAVVDLEVEIPADGRRLGGHLMIPASAVGVVLFAHGSGSSRHSPRNQSVASSLNRDGIGTLLFDLLDASEALDRSNVFDIGLLADRLTAATTWIMSQPAAEGLGVGYFGASTGAAAALVAAARPELPVRAVVSRGGRPDLATVHLGLVRAPTLLIVGGLDSLVIELNQEAARQLTCEHRIEIVPGATHLFEETGTLEAVATLARSWFVTYLPDGSSGATSSSTSDR